ncbi:hypothetical protein SMD44_p10127 (plasmid) [Streptomyces alboflavus]|uniref:Uncharacterized protein n=1 Tax=Streptomyces alboflavus TaxID=67267 RepID=A0A291W4P3_9ACTN|nr:hypothetical protein [Streptomyces alboflavus]ATM24626.1 hypothetical protein SMD44_p10127 [Streptomyces alboflavus]
MTITGLLLTAARRVMPFLAPVSPLTDWWRHEQEALHGPFATFRTGAQIQIPAPWDSSPSPTCMDGLS